MGIQINGNNDIISALDGSWTAEGASINTSGILTATTFKGNVTGTACTFVDGNFTGNVTVGGTLTYEDVTNIDSVGLITARGGIVAQDDVTFTTANSNNILFDKSDNLLRFGDNVLARFGNDNDLEMYHTGSTGYIKNTTGTLYIQDDSNIIIGSVTGSETGAKYIKDGAYELYHNNILKLATDLDGIRIGSGGGDNTIVDLHNASYDNGVIQYYNGSINLKTGTSNGDRQISLSTAGDERFKIESTGRTFIKTDESTTGLIVQNTVHDSQLRIEASAANKNSIIQFADGADGDVGMIDYDHDGNYLAFTTNANERKRIASDGQGIHNYTTACNPKEIYNWSNNKTGMSFRSASTERGNIFFLDSGVAFNTSSDYRLKENVTSISDGITRVKQLIPRKFNWIIDESNTPVDGFLAHEVSSTVPEAISGTKDAAATQEDVDSGRSQTIGDPIYQMIDHSKLVPLLTAALQEAITKIETLETKVAALEAK